MQSFARLAFFGLLLSFASAAHADTIVTVPVPGYLPNNGSISGTITVDATTGVTLGLDLTVDYESQTYVFDTIHYQDTFNTEYYLTSYDSSGDILLIGYPGSLVGYDGSGQFCSASVSCPAYSSFFDFAGTANPIFFNEVGPSPEPSSLILLGTGVVGIAGVARRRFVRS